ncbi:hypothetical protein V6N13_088217 [Hibiscus sabdariffa]
MVQEAFTLKRTIETNQNELKCKANAREEFLGDEVSGEIRNSVLQEVFSDLWIFLHGLIDRLQNSIMFQDQCFMDLIPAVVGF